VWSDPNRDCKTFEQSARGFGVQFGVRALEEFLATMGLGLVLRAHECVPSGTDHFGKTLHTVFSYSQYEGQNNCCGLLFLDLHLNIELFSLPPMDQMRADALLQPFVHNEQGQEMQASDSLTLNLRISVPGQGKPKYIATAAKKGEFAAELCKGWARAQKQERAAGEDSAPYEADVRGAEVGEAPGPRQRGW
jgi:hypothetical protein